MAEKLLSALIILILIMTSMVGCTYEGPTQTKEIELQSGDSG
ncbi:MAG: hypothetical protein ACOX3L_06820 [Lutisporaceae bacterium]|jgi:hypothetical protein